MYQDTKAIIERVKRINAQYQHLELAVEAPLAQIKPGQSLLVRPNAEAWQPYLREHWHAINIQQHKLLIERPGGIRYEPGQIVDALGLIGQPLRFRRTLRNVMLVAYNSPPTALLLTIPSLLGNNVAVTLVLLGDALHYSTQHLPPEVEVLRGGAVGSAEELIWPNQVLTIGWADQVFLVVGQNNENGQFEKMWRLFRSLRAEVPKNYLFGVFQQPLACGVGACGCCIVNTSDGQRVTCTEGPSFDLSLMDYRL
jgi:hypothetical protein